MQNFKKIICFSIFIFFLLPLSTFNTISTTTTYISQNYSISFNSHRSKYVVVPIHINVVEGTKISKEQIEKNIKKMNEIYNCEVVIFVWDGKINQISDPSKPGGKADGKINNLNERTTIRNKASTNSGGNGVSITICSDLGDNINGYSIIGESHSALVINSTEGDTWAHEVQHSLGQSHGNERQADEDMNGDGKVDSNDQGWDANGDGKITPEDRKYNLWGRKSDRSDNKISPYYHDMIFGNASKVPGAKVKNRPPKSVPAKPSGGAKTKKSAGASDNTTDQVDGLKNARTDVPHTDIVKCFININYTESFAKFILTLGDNPSKFVNWSYSILLDTLPGSGVPSGFFSGADFNISFVNIMGVSEYFLFEWMGFWSLVTPLELTTSTPTETIDLSNSTGSSDNPNFPLTDLFTVILDQTTFNKLNLNGPFGLWATSKWYDSVNDTYVTDNISRQELFISDELEPAISVNNDNPTAGNSITLNGSCFAPNSNIYVKIDGTNISSFISSVNGTFSQSINIPRSLSKTNAILEVIDSQGNIDALYIDVNPQPTTTPSIPSFTILLSLLSFPILLLAHWISKKKIKTQI